MAHKTLIDGTAYEISGGKTLVDGTAYSIKSGKTLVDGTAYEIGFGTKIGDLAVGSSVFMNVSGVATEFLVVHQGLPNDTLYDSSCNGTWLLMKDCVTKMKWASDTAGGANAHRNNAIHPYLNSTFLDMLDWNIQDAIKWIKIPYCAGGSSNTLYTGSNGLSCQVFQLSAYELGFTQSDDSSLPADGAKLDYFDKKAKYSTKFSGATIAWWLRSVNTKYSRFVFFAGSDSSYIGSNWADDYSYGVRPALILPPETLVDENFNIIA